MKTANASRPAELRQLALVYDWCAESIGDAARSGLLGKLKPALEAPADAPTAVRSQVLAALAIADEEPKAAQEAMKRAVEGWWRGKVIPVVQAGNDPFEKREDLMAAMEFLHVIRDNLRVDLREAATKWFDQLAALQMLRYYPQPWPSAENEYRIPCYEGSANPDLREAALSRAAELALVAFDTNARPNLFLQGWLMQDRFLMRGTFGIAYEFLWANPYLPGLSFTYMPDLYHSDGRLLVRSGWEEDATWFGWWRDARNGIRTQAFKDSRRVALKPDSRIAPIALGPVRVHFASASARFEFGWMPPAEEGERPVEEVAFVVGLEPNSAYDVEIDDEGMYEVHSDSGGIVEIRTAAGRKAGVRMKMYTATVK
jgi:hypothetical protein